MQRFWAKVNKTNTCWLWTARCFPNGYGGFYLNGRTCLAHRVSWELFHGKQPTLQILHSCDVRSCVNPDHLFEGSQKDNMQDMNEKGRSRHYGQFNGSAKLTPDQVYAMRLLSQFGKSYADIARIFENDPSHVRKIIIGKRWNHI